MCDRSVFSGMWGRRGGSTSRGGDDLYITMAGFFVFGVFSDRLEFQGGGGTRGISGEGGSKVPRVVEASREVTGKS